MVKKLKYIVLIIFATQLPHTLFAQQKAEVIADYYCRNSDVTQTVVRDSNGDGIYDTYTVLWCNGNTNTYPIMAIGDIRKWPPSGIPTREVLSSNQNNRTLVEAYFTNSNNVIFCWFVRLESCDTVFYYDNRPKLELMTEVSDYISNSIQFKVLPNPAKDYVEINYSLNQNGWVTITLYNEIGIIADVIEEKYKKEGTYNFIYNLKYLSSGKYFMTVKLGMDEIFTRQIVIVK